MRYATRIGVSTLAISAFVASAAAAQEFNWRQFEGEEIYGLVFAAPYTDSWMKPQVEEFEELTGITVQIEAMVDTQMRKKQDIILAGQDSSLDFYTLQMDNRGGALTSAGYLEDLQPYLDDPTLTPADYNYPEDWAGGCLNTVKVIKGQSLNNLVFSAQAQLLHIRKDLFEEHGVKIPATMEELEAAAKALTIKDADGNVEMYGFLSRGWGRLTTASFATYLFNHGASWFRFEEDGTRVANIDSPEAIDAFEFYGRMIRDYGPAAALNNRPEANAAMFAAGKTAMLSALNYYIYQFEDPNRSRVAGKVATILVPSGPGGSFPNTPTTSLAISPFSKHKKAAWLFIAWITQKEQMLYGMKNGAPMCRKSVWTDPEYTPPTPSWGESAQIAIDYGIAIAKPQAIAISEMRDAVGEVVNVAIRDGSRAAIEAEAKKQAAVMNQLIAQTEKGVDFQGPFRGDRVSVPPEKQVLPIEAIDMSH
ncbi:MAG TPA: extracellular solute-binding protein [Geminicoccaceae bacterium]|nr:extracellular solute-binding protein [Geminicoccaceae bacterium]